MPIERIETLIIGGGQAGLTMSHMLSQRRQTCGVFVNECERGILNSSEPGSSSRNGLSRNNHVNLKNKSSGRQSLPAELSVCSHRNRVGRTEYIDGRRNANRR
jgi:thioredoxin reductase